MTRRAGCAMNGVEVLLGSFIIKPFRFSPFLFPGADSNPTSSGNWAEASPIIFARQSRNCSVLKRTDKLPRNESHRGLFRIARFSNWKTLFWHSRIAESSAPTSCGRHRNMHSRRTIPCWAVLLVSQDQQNTHLRHIGCRAVNSFASLVKSSGESEKVSSCAIM